MEHLIELVKCYPSLYDLKDPDYKNLSKKDEIWNTISNELNEDSDSVKKKGRNLRDLCKAFEEYSHKNGQSAKRYKNWQWAKHMEVFKPFLSFASTVSNVSSSQTEEESLDISLSEQPSCSSTPSTSASAQKRRNTSQSALTEVIDHIKNKRSRAELDATDTIFLGYAKTIKKISLKRQVEIKYEFAQIIMRHEIAHLEEQSEKENESVNINTPSENETEDSLALYFSNFQE